MRHVERDANRSLMRHLAWIVIFGICLAGGGLVSVRLGPDFNWDLQNYHLYNPFAFLTGRIGRDFMAAGIQSYLNPLLDVPFYLSWTSWFHERPCVTALLAGLPYGVAIFLCLRIAMLMFSVAGESRVVEVVAAVVIGVTGTVTVSEVGTTFNDIPIAVLILGALFVELRRLEQDRASGLAAGILFGLAGGLKMTAVVFAPGFALAIMLTRRDWRSAIVAALWFSSGWLLGYVIAGGWWAWKLYQLFGNPIFPMFNHAFRSPWFADVGRDLRFMPHGVLQKLFYPFYWVEGKRYVSEVPMRDPRFALAYVASVVVATLLWFSARAGSRPRAGGFPAVQRKRAVLLLVFFAVSFTIWQTLFSIARYMLTLELLTGILIVLAIRWVCQSMMTFPAAGRAPAMLAAVVAVLAIEVSMPMDWGRMQYPNVPALVDSRITLPDDATVLVIGAPVAFVLPFIRSADSSFVGIDGNTVSLPDASPAARFIHEKLSRLGGTNNWVLTNGAIDTANDLVRPYGLRVADDACQAISQSPQPNIRLCPLGHSSI